MKPRKAFFLALVLVAALAAGAVLFTRKPALVEERRGLVSNDALGRALQAERIERERSRAQYAELDRQHERERYEAEAAARRAAEIEQERRVWSADIVTTCDGRPSGRRPSICVERVGSEIRQLGAPVALKLSWRNLPHGAYIRLWVRNGAAAGERWQYSGPNGAILPDFVASAPSGRALLRWDGKSTWCAPADAPMLCDNGEIGSYVVRAGILTGSDPFWPSWPIRNPTPVRWLALSETQPITLTGDPRVFDNVPDATFGPVNGPFRRLVPESYLIQNNRLEPKPRLGEWRSYWGRRSRCRTVILSEPYHGSPELCFPKSRLDRYGLKLRPWDVYPQGTIGIAPGVMSPGEARERARIAAFRRTAGAARYITYGEAEKAARQSAPRDSPDSRMEARNRGFTYTSQEQVYAYFHRDGRGPYWIITLSQAIKTLNYEEYVTSPETMAYRVDADGRTCLLGTGRGFDAEADHSCPK